MTRKIKYCYQVVLYTWDEEINEYRVCKDRIYNTKKQCKEYAKDIILANPEKDHIDYVRVRVDMTDDYIKISGEDL